jgi:hypothetical protein
LFFAAQSIYFARQSLSDAVAIVVIRSLVRQRSAGRECCLEGRPDMEIYTDLFESMMDCYYLIGFRHGLVYTAAMLALGLGICLNLLTIIDLLWSLGVLDNPYLTNGSLHPQQYVCALLCGGFVANSAVARIKFGADRHCPRLTPELQPPQISMPKPKLIRTPGPAYVLGSGVLFLATLTLDLLVCG